MRCGLMLLSGTEDQTDGVRWTNTVTSWIDVVAYYSDHYNHFRAERVREFY